MRRTGIFFFLAALVALTLLTASVALRAQEAKPQAEKPPDEPKKGGTGVVPPGVKLGAKMPEGAPTKPYPFPKPVTKTLANGLRVFVVSSAEQPVVTVRLVLPGAGSIHDPAGKPGVAEMTANLVTQGTGRRSAQEIAEAIDFVGGSLSTNAGSDGTYATVTVVKKDFAVGMDLLSDVIRNASFKDEELDRRRQQALSGLRVAYNDPAYLATAVFRRLVFGGHPYGLPDEGTPETVRVLKRDDLAKFRDTRYVPNGALLAFAGDITPEAAFAAAEKYFGNWGSGGSTAPPAAVAQAPAARRGLRILLLDKPDAGQTQIRVGRLGLPRSSPDYIPLAVTNRIFGGGFNSRLSTEVRIHKGLTYGATSAFDSRKQAGAFTASTSTRTEATVEATRLVVDLLAKMSTGEVTKEELDFARDYLAGVFPIQTETAEQVAGSILTVAQYGLPTDYYETYQQRILAVGPPQVKTMAGKYFSTGDLEIVLVGNVGAFRDAVKKEFPNAQFEEMPFDQVDLLAADLRRPKEVAGAASPEALERGKALLHAATESAGGAALGKVESFMTAGKIKIFTPQGEIEGDLKLTVALPDHVQTEVSLPFGVMRQGFDGKLSWAANPQGVNELPASQNAESQRSVMLASGMGFYREALAGKVEVALVGEEEVEGRKFVAAEWNSPAGKVKLYFDAETRLLSGTRFRANSPQGGYESLSLWSDFRVVEGVKVPFKVVNYRDGSKFTEQSTQEVKINSKIDPAIFSKPAQ